MMTKFAQIRDTAQCGDEEEMPGHKAREDVQHLHSYVNRSRFRKYFEKIKSSKKGYAFVEYLI